MNQKKIVLNVYLGLGKVDWRKVKTVSYHLTVTLNYYSIYLSLEMLN